MPRALRGLLAALLILTFLAGGVVVALLLPLVALRGGSPAARAARARRTVRAAFRAFVRVLRVTRMLDLEAPTIEVAGPCVIVANHPTLFDVVLLQSVVPDLVVVVKASWSRAPLMGSIVRRCGWIAGPARSAAHPGHDDDPPVAPGKGGAPEVAVVLERMVTALQGGATLLVFPEGTRSPPGGLRRFRVGACEAARRAGVPVVPLAMRCDPPVLARGWIDVPPGLIRARIELHPTLGPRDWPDARAMTRDLRARYEAWLGLPAVEATTPLSSQGS